MITKEALLAMTPGTEIFVAAPGNLRNWTINKMSREVFVKFIDHPEDKRKAHILLSSGGMSFLYAQEGKALYLDGKEAANFMDKRQIDLYHQELKNKSSEIERLKMEISRLEASGSGERNWLYHDNTYTKGA